MSGYYGHETPTDVEELWTEVRKLRTRVAVLEKRLPKVMAEQEAFITERQQP